MVRLAIRFYPRHPDASSDPSPADDQDARVLPPGAVRVLVAWVCIHGSTRFSTIFEPENQQNWGSTGIMVSYGFIGCVCLPEALSPSPPFLSHLGCCVHFPDALSRFSCPFLFPVLDTVSVLASVPVACDRALNTCYTQPRLVCGGVIYRNIDRSGTASCRACR